LQLQCEPFPSTSSYPQQATYLETYYPYSSQYLQFQNSYESNCYAGYYGFQYEYCPAATSSCDLPQVPPQNVQEQAHPPVDNLQELQLTKHKQDIYVATFERPENDANTSIIGEFLTTSSPLNTSEYLRLPPQSNATSPLDYSHSNYNYFSPLCSTSEQTNTPQNLPLSRLLHKTPSARLKVSYRQ
jgi:hypothetical protein